MIRSPCLTCNGKTFVNKRVKETVSIPKGVNSGINLRLSGKGNFSPNGLAGDLMLKISVKPHPYFKRDGFDILTDCYVSVADAILGNKIEIETLDGKVTLQVDPGT